MQVKIKTLPDIDKWEHLPEEYDNYGRFGFTTAGFFYILGLHSSHFANTVDGGYWAVCKRDDCVYLSPRGYSENFEHVVKEIINQKHINKIFNFAGIPNDRTFKIK